MRLLGLNLLQAVFFFQPLFRVACRQLHLAAEEQCDAWGASHLEDRLAMARCLTEVAAWVLPQDRRLLVAGMARRRSQLGVRVERLMDDSCSFTARAVATSARLDRPPFLPSHPGLRLAWRPLRQPKQARPPKSVNSPRSSFSLKTPSYKVPAILNFPPSTNRAWWKSRPPCESSKRFTNSPWPNLGHSPAPSDTPRRWNDCSARSKRSAAHSPSCATSSP